MKQKKAKPEKIRHDKRERIDRFKTSFFIAPSFIGAAIFFILPFFVVGYYALIDNPISRYCVNDRSGLHRNADGSVDVTLSKDAPEDTTNWLPVSDEKFHLFLRIYKPDWTALDSFPPPVISVK